MTTPVCGVDAERLLSYVANPAADAALSDHIPTCYDCQVRLLAMGGGAMTRGADRSTCLKVLKEIPTLLAAEVAGMAESSDFWPVQMHLLLCSDCFAAYQAMRRMNEMILDDTLPLPPLSAYRPPDLSFLHDAQPTRRPTLLQTLRLNLALLFQPRQAVPVPVRKEKAGQLETPSSAQPTFERVWGAEELGDLNVEVKAYPDLNDAAQVRLKVEVHRVTRFDAAGIRVALWMGNAPAIVRHTDSLGVVEFEGLTEDGLHTAVLEITPTPPGDPPPT